MNALKTTALLGVMTGLLLAIGSFFGNQGLVIAMGLAVVFNVGSYWFSDMIVLKMYRAQPADPSQFAALHAVVERLAGRAGLPKPAIYILPTPGANAFATGRNPQHSAVAVTAGLLQMLDEQELEGVLAHELAHVKNRRHPGLEHRCHHGRRHHDDGSYSWVCRDVRRWTRSQRRWRRHGSARNDDCRTVSRGRSSNGRISHTRVEG